MRKKTLFLILSAACLLYIIWEISTLDIISNIIYKSSIYGTPTNFPINGSELATINFVYIAFGKQKHLVDTIISAYYHRKHFESISKSFPLNKYQLKIVVFAENNTWQQTKKYVSDVIFDYIYFPEELLQTDSFYDMKDFEHKVNNAQDVRFGGGKFGMNLWFKRCCCWHYAMNHIAENRGNNHDIFIYLDNDARICQFDVIMNLLISNQYDVIDGYAPSSFGSSYGDPSIPGPNWHPKWITFPERNCGFIAMKKNSKSISLIDNFKQIYKEQIDECLNGSAKLWGDQTAWREAIFRKIYNLNNSDDDEFKEKTLNATQACRDKHSTCNNHCVWSHVPEELTAMMFDLIN